MQIYTEDNRKIFISDVCKNVVKGVNLSLQSLSIQLSVFYLLLFLVTEQ